MIAQSVILPNEVCNCIELYFHVRGNVIFNDEKICLKGKSCCDTRTYMNFFDTGAWKKYTGIKDWVLQFTVSGSGMVHLYCVSGKEEKHIYTLRIDDCLNEQRRIEFEASEGMYYIVADTEDEMRLSYIAFSPSGKAQERSIHLAVIICTYRRKQQVKNLLSMIKKSLFFAKGNPFYGRMGVRIVDNASELPETKEKDIKIYHNPNTGGSGGFSRGMEECRKDEEEYGITNVILMDDDVDVIPESFYRLYALLTWMKEEYQNEVIAGRMFRMDQRHVQYTAAEIWNGGDIQHVGWNLDMKKVESLNNLNQSDGEYTGWWFGCFPMNFVRENSPLPFFLHCDDVEYGLRHGGTPIVLNGIQVWHETYEYRESQMLAYYDMRNSLIVNTIYKIYKDPGEVFDNWKKGMDYYSRCRKYDLKYATAVAMKDYMKGGKYFLYAKGNKKRKKLPVGNTLFIRGVAALYWRYIYILYKPIGEKAFLSYKDIFNEWI